MARRALRLYTLVWFPLQGLFERDESVTGNLHFGFRLGEIRVDPLRGVISRPSGERHLQPKVMDVLVCLAERAGAVVERSEILESVWGRPTTEEVLTRCISELRTALDDKRDRPEYIQTVPKRGYRLLKAVETDANNATSAGEDEGEIGSWHEVIDPPSPAMALASVAVLPFENHSNDESQHYLAEAFASELQGSLARVDRLRVASRRSAASCMSAGLDANAIGRRLGVRYLISGGLQSDGRRIRVIAELDDTQSGTQVWAKKYDRDSRDILALEVEIAESIVTAFATRQQLAELAWARSAPISSLDAWGLVQKSRSMALEYTVASLRAAMAPLIQAIELDPGYAAAHATLSSVLIEGLVNGLSDDPAANAALARDSAEEAMSLAPRDPFILKMVSLAWVYFGNHRKAAACLNNAIRIAPFDFGTWGYLGWPLTASGAAADLEELQRILDRLIEMEPEHPGLPFWLYHRSVARACRRDFEAAVQPIEEALELRPAFSLAWIHLANLLGQQDQKDLAQGALERCHEINPAMTIGHYRSLVERICGGNSNILEARTAGLPEE
jgi:TolB-like protein